MGNRKGQTILRWCVSYYINPQFIWDVASTCFITLGSRVIPDRDVTPCFIRSMTSSPPLPFLGLPMAYFSHFTHLFTVGTKRFRRIPSRNSSVHAKLWELDENCLLMQSHCHAHPLDKWPGDPTSAYHSASMLLKHNSNCEMLEKSRTKILQTVWTQHSFQGYISKPFGTPPRHQPWTAARSTLPPRCSRKRAAALTMSDRTYCLRKHDKCVEVDIAWQCDTSTATYPRMPIRLYITE